MTQDGKSAVASKGVQGSCVAIGGGILPILEFFGVLPPGSTPILVPAACSIVGGLWGLIGRLTAKKRITSLLPR